MVGPSSLSCWRWPGCSILWLRRLSGLLGLAPRANPRRVRRMTNCATRSRTHRDGQVVKLDRDRMGGLLDLAELEVSDVMVHRTEHALDQCRRAAGEHRAGDDPEPAHPHAAVARLARQHRRRAARQGRAARPRRCRLRLHADRRPQDRVEALVRARHDQAARTSSTPSCAASRISRSWSTNMARSKGC